MKIGVLTSSRADYGIYMPLLSKLSKDDRFELTIIAFGMHLQKQHGETIKNIVADNFSNNIHKVLGMPVKDSQLDISKGYGEIIIEFSKYWNENKYDYILALGDRFEMSAAVQASMPFGIKIAHLHGGEITLGAIDNIYRHQITIASKIHFVATAKFAEKVNDITGTSDNVYNVGALSLDGVKELDLPKWKDVRELFDIPDKKFILTTFHPETVNPDKNIIYSEIIFKVLEEICQNTHVIITLANADTMGSLFRNSSKDLKNKYPMNITLISNFGKNNYFSAMKASEMLLGNTSSGILEAASFGKYVINVGNRQLGRLRSDNVIDVSFDKNEIIESIKRINGKKDFKGKNKYLITNTANKIIEILANDGL